MRLTTYTDYTLRTLIHLALAPDRLTTIADIAQGYDISSNHLMKVVYQLGLAGYVETIRGKNGGMRLGRPPESINVGEVVRRMEPDLHLAPCFAGPGHCAIQPDCVLQTALGQALDAFLEVLDRYTLADLVRPGAQLAALLRIDLQPHSQSA
jgi:Rrf2 family nitric oxide-sensitive transcriptional repressor